MYWTVTLLQLFIFSAMLIFIYEFWGAVIWCMHIYDYSVFTSLIQIQATIPGCWGFKHRSFCLQTEYSNPLSNVSSNSIRLKNNLSYFNVSLNNSNVWIISGSISSYCFPLTEATFYFCLLSTLLMCPFWEFCKQVRIFKCISCRKQHAVVYTSRSCIHRALFQLSWDRHSSTSVQFTIRFKHFHDRIKIFPPSVLES